VRTVPRHRPDPRGGREGIRREDARGKGERRRQPRDRLAFGVRGIPTLILFKDGQIKGQMVGVNPKSNIVSLVTEKPLRSGASFVALIAGLLLAAGCGPKAITVGSRPFPAGTPVFSDASGKAIETLPADGGRSGSFFSISRGVRVRGRLESGADGRGAVSSRRRPNLSDLFDRETALSPAGQREVPRCAPPLSRRRRPGARGSGGHHPHRASRRVPQGVPREPRTDAAPSRRRRKGGTAVDRFLGEDVRELSSEFRRRSRDLSPHPPGT